MKKPMWSLDLGSLCSEMERVLDQLIALSLEKEKALVANDLPLLEGVVLREEDLVAALKALSDGERLLEGNPIPPDHPLKQKALRLRALNASNGALVRTALRLVQHELRLFFPDDGYQGEATRTGPLRFDRKV